MDESRKIKRTISILKERVCSVEKYYMSKCSIKALSYAIEILGKKFILWLFCKHKWHKDWLGCWVCELRLKNNFDKPVNCYGEK